MQMLETLLQSVRSACAAFPDKRRGEVTYSMADIGLSAFSLFFMQSESFLAHQRALEEGRKMSNCQSLFGMTAVPTDNHIRAMLDPVPPSYLQPAFDHSLDMLRQHDGLRGFQRLGGRVLIALDGTEYFCSQKLGCPQTPSGWSICGPSTSATTCSLASRLRRRSPRPAGTSSSRPSPRRTRPCMTSCKAPRSISTRSGRRPTASA